MGLNSIQQEDRGASILWNMPFFADSLLGALHASHTNHTTPPGSNYYPRLKNEEEEAQRG